MKTAIISKEFFIGRYIYLTREFEALPNITFISMGHYDGVSLKLRNEKEKRITNQNTNWPRYESMAKRRLKLKEQKEKLMEMWSSEYSGSLSTLAAGYRLVPNVNNRFNSELWESFKADTNQHSKSHTYSHNGIMMRSVFETTVAQILDDMGIEYKYEVELDLGEEGRVFPDMALNFPEFNRCGFVEALGLLDDEDYILKTSRKFSKYTKNGLYINRDFQFIPADYNYRPESQEIKKMISIICDTIAAQYVIKKS